MKIAMAQINTTVGDIDGNCRKVIDYSRRAADAGADLIVFPELTTLGYPPKDLLLRAGCIERNIAAVDRIAEATSDISVIVGFAAHNPHGPGKALRNAAALCQGGKVVSVHGKNLLPTYDVFDETRYFAPDPSSDITEAKIDNRVWRIGFTICEDLWNNEQFIDQQVYDQDPIADLAAARADFVINISASPYWVGKQQQRVKIFSRQVAEHKLPLVYVNQVGANDDLVFDGASSAFAADGSLIAQAKAFEEDLVIVDLDDTSRAEIADYPDRIESVRLALVTGIRDYIAKCGFKEVVIGLSGGIDSAITAALAVEALGADQVHGVAMPSSFSSDHSLTDARALAANLGIDFRVVPIASIYDATQDALAESFAGTPFGVAEENIQARARGQVLMALSNKFGWLLLTTGNKSELAVGYCTLYGDMCGGLAVISDVPKMMVYELARHINARTSAPPIPESSITKPPSAELREGQLDADSLPPYETLDDILWRYVEMDQSPQQIASNGINRNLVNKIVALVDRNEYKRSQAALGIKVTARAFGSGRRMPIAARLC